MFPAFHTKKMQGISTNLFVFGRKYSNFAARASRPLRYFPNVSYSRFFTAVRCHKNKLAISYQCEARLKKTPKWVVRFNITVGLPSHPYFVPPIQVFLDLGCDYCTWNRLEALKIALLSLAKNGRYPNWFGLIIFIII